MPETIALSNADLHHEVQQHLVASGFPHNFIKWLHVPGGGKREDLIKPSKTLAFAVMTSLLPSAQEGQMGMNCGVSVGSQDYAIFMSRCALGRRLQSSDPVLSICFPELQIVPLPSCCFTILQMQICPITEWVLPLMEEISPSRVVCTFMDRSYVSLLMCTTDCLHMLSGGKKQERKTGNSCCQETWQWLESHLDHFQSIGFVFILKKAPS